LLVIFCSIRNSDIEKQSGGHNDGVDCINKIHDPKRALMLRHAMSLLLCVIAVLCVDPLFLYLPVINQDDKCLKLDKRLMITSLCLRSVNDMIYVGNIIFGYISRRHDDRKPRQIIKMYLRLYFAIDILALLPIPQVRETFLLLNLSSFLFFCDFFFSSLTMQ
jgi:cyclic nucleotide gated channel